MDDKYINSFKVGVKEVLANFNVTVVKEAEDFKKEKMEVDTDITAVLGIVGDIRGNVTFSMSRKTAKKIVSYMLIGMPDEEVSQLAISAVGELSNMITGTSVRKIEKESGFIIDITPPSVIFGRDMYFMITNLETVGFNMETEHGNVQVNLAMEEA